MANLGTVNLPQSGAGGGDGRRQENRDRTTARSASGEKEVNERGNARLPKRSTEAKNLNDDEQKMYEKLTQLNKVTKTCQDAKEQSQQQAVKSTTNCRQSRA